MNTLSTTNDGKSSPPDQPEVQESANDFLQMIHNDNGDIAELFFQFSQVEEDQEKRGIFENIKSALTIHSQIGEELLYPLVVEVVDEEDKEEAQKLVAETEAGNYIASLILDELTITDTDDEYFDAKMAILHDLVKEQVKREEKEMFEKLLASDISFEDIASEAIDMKEAFSQKARRAPAGKKSKAVKASGTSKPKSSAKKAEKSTPNKAKQKASKTAKSSKPAARTKTTQMAAKKKKKR